MRLATVCGQCIAGTLAMIFNIKKNPDLHITLRRFRPHGEIIGKILSVGVPSVIMVAIGSVMNYFLNLILYSFSKLAVAVFGAYFKVQSMAFMPVFGLNNGMIPIISYNYGAQKPDRMKRTMKLGVMVGCSIMVFCLAIMQVFPGQILKIFDATDEMLLMGIPAVRDMSTACLYLRDFRHMFGNVSGCRKGRVQYDSVYGETAFCHTSCGIFPVESNEQCEWCVGSVPYRRGFQCDHIDDLSSQGL